MTKIISFKHRIIGLTMLFCITTGISYNISNQYFQNKNKSVKQEEILITNNIIPTPDNTKTNYIIPFTGLQSTYTPIPFKPRIITYKPIIKTFIPTTIKLTKAPTLKPLEIPSPTINTTTQLILETPTIETIPPQMQTKQPIETVKPVPTIQPLETVKPLETIQSHTTTLN